MFYLPLTTKYFQGMTRKPSHSKAVSQDPRSQQGPNKDALHPLPALPLPKRPATKPDVTRKPPAVAPADDQTAPIMGLNSDKTSHYSNVSSQAKKTAKNNLALPLAPSIPPNNQASSTAPPAPKHSSQSSTPQVSSEAGKAQQAHSSAPKPRSESKSSPPNLLSPIPGNLSTNPFLDLIQTEDTVKSISQSFSGGNQTEKTILTSYKISGLGVQSSIPKSNILTHSNDQNLIESLPLPNKPAPR